MIFRFTIKELPATADEVQITYNISGDEQVENLENLQVQIFEVTELRDNWKMSQVVGTLPEHGTKTILSISGLKEGLYTIGSVTSNDTQFGQQVSHTIAGNRSFKIPFLNSVEQAQEEVERIYSQREAVVTKVLVANDAPESAPIFTVILYFAGVKLHNAFSLSGAEIYPVDGTLGVEGIETPVVADLAKTFNQSLPFSPNTKSVFQSANQLFAIKFFRISATKIENAVLFAQEFARKIVTLIAIERGEKPKHCATFVGGDEGYFLYPEFDVPRGNLLAPMFADSHPSLIERYHPVMEKSDYARFLVTLLSEAIGERSVAIQVWRCWVILEQVAKKHIKSDNLSLSHPDGTPVLSKKGVRTLSKGARGKVYQYLIENKWRAFDLIKSAEDGRCVRIEGADAASHDASKEMIKLWDAVGAIYDVRNQVAHKGYAAKSVPPTPTEMLADRLIGDRNFNSGFLIELTDWVVWGEVERINEALPRSKH